MNALDVLRKGRALISNPDNWCTGRMFHGGRMCTAGAIRIAAGLKVSPYQTPSLDQEAAVWGAWFALLEATGAKRLSEWNDSCTHDQVLAGWDKAIAAESALAGLEQLRSLLNDAQKGAAANKVPVDEAPSREVERSGAA